MTLAQGSALRKACFALKARGKDEHNILCGQPAVLGDIAIPATRQYQFPAPVLGLMTEQRVVGQQFHGLAHTQHPGTGPSRIVFGEKVEQPLEIGKRLRRYFDPRQRRARGRRAFAPAARASR
ncbi:hypothetical protein GPROT2_00156 [Gammaproteobacteria bacterium]|nr:hypothetical protein GPROT2_00156 [Gammaproteobacteria bacterium]